MSLVVDLRRELEAGLRKLHQAMEPINSTISFTVCGGTSIHDVLELPEETPEHLRMIGGWYDAISGDLNGMPELPVVRARLTPQQLGPVNSESQLVTLIGAQRSGKSRVGFLCGGKILFRKPGSKILYVVPSYQKQEIVTELIDEYLAHFIEKSNKNDHIWEFKNTSKLKIFTIAGGQASVPNEAFLGFSADAIILEEYREFPHAQTVFTSAFSRIINSGGQLIIVTSPEMGHYIEDIVVHRVLDEDMEVFYLSALDNFLGKTNKDDPDEIFRKAKRVYPKNKYLKDVLGQFVPDDDVDFNEFSRDEHVIPKPPGVDVTSLIWQSDLWLGRARAQVANPADIIGNPDQRMDTILGLDFGKNIMSGVAIRASLDINRNPFPHDLTFESLHLTVIHELVQKNTNLVKYINEVLLRFFREPRRVAIFCDPAGIKKSELDGRSMVGTLQRAGFWVFCPTSYPPRQQAVDVVNMRFKLDRLHVLPGCTRTIDSLIKFKSDGRTQKDISRDPFGHLPDALKYVVTYLFPWVDLLRPENKKYLDLIAKKYSDEDGIIP